MSDNTFNIAVSVECLARYADWRLAQKSWEREMSQKLSHSTSLSTYFEITESLEIGQYDPTSILENFLNSSR